MLEEMDITPNRPVVIGASALAFVAACVAHEVVGHGGACLLGGGTIDRLSSVYFHCSGADLPADLGGPVASAVLGLAALALLRRGQRGAAARAFLAFSFAINLLWVVGCLLWSSLAAQSDFAYAARLLGRWETAGRIVLGVAGIGLGVFTCRVLARQRLPRQALRTGYVTAGLVSCIAALLYAGPVLPALREAFLEGFGALAWLLFVPGVGASSHAPGAATQDATRDRLLLASAALAVLGFAAVLGRGYG